METRKSNPNKPLRIMPYGVEGVGKSTLGAKSDRPIFISPEGGTDQLTNSSGEPVDEMLFKEPKLGSDGKPVYTSIDNWDKLIASLKRLVIEPHDFKTVVLDSADWIEGLAHRKIIGSSDKTITTVDGGYGAGYRKSQNMHQELIEILATLRDARNMNVVVPAHAHVKTVKDPGVVDDYDAFEIKCHEFVSSLWREWVDGLFFIRFKTFSKSGELNDTAKARAFSDGTRVIYTVKQPAFQAKNRYGMPPEMVFTENFWQDLVGYARKAPKQDDPVAVEELRCRMLDDIVAMVGFVDEPTRMKVMAHVEEKKNDIEELKATLARLEEITNIKRKGA